MEKRLFLGCKETPRKEQKTRSDAHLKKTDCNALAHPLIVFRTTLNLRPMHTFKKTYCDIHSYETLEAEPQEARGKQEEKAKQQPPTRKQGVGGTGPFFP